MAAIDAEEHRERNGQGGGVDGLTDARRRRARRLGTPASMASRARGGEGRRGLRGNAHCDAGSTTVQSMESGRARSRSIRRRRVADPARARGRLRRLESKSRLRLLREEEVDDGEHEGHSSLTSRARWPRLPRRCAPASSRTSMKSDVGGGGRR